jgi:dienelactone hydrolase
LRRSARRCFALAALTALAPIPGAFASAEELVKFHAAAPRGQPDAAAESIRGYLTRPKGAGPFPAVVLLHSCLGLPADRRSIGGAIAGWGYVALFVDDFTTRGLKETCAVDFPQGLSDAFGALAFLSTLADVDPRRIAAIGWSQGADAALGIAGSPSGAGFSIADGLKFMAAAAIYPPCENRANASLQIPTLILVGGADAVTPAADCERLAKRQSGDRPGVKLVVYPGADHGFDNREFAGGKRLLGMWLEYDRQAAERSRAELRDFLAAKLAR